MKIRAVNEGQAGLIGMLNPRSGAPPFLHPDDNQASDVGGLTLQSVRRADGASLALAGFDPHGQDSLESSCYTLGSVTLEADVQQMARLSRSALRERLEVNITDIDEDSLGKMHSTLKSLSNVVRCLAGRNRGVWVVLDEHPEAPAPGPVVAIANALIACVPFPSACTSASNLWAESYRSEKAGERMAETHRLVLMLLTRALVFCACSGCACRLSVSAETAASSLLTDSCTLFQWCRGHALGACQ